MSIDAHDLLLGGMDAAGENARLGWRRIAGRPHHSALIHTSRQRRKHASAWFVAPGDADKTDPRPQNGSVMGGVAGATRKHLGRVVFENQHRGFARDPRDTAVHEFVRDEVAEDDDPDVGEAIDEV